jgi:hypothetical protein
MMQKKQLQKSLSRKSRLKKSQLNKSQLQKKAREKGIRMGLNINLVVDNRPITMCLKEANFFQEPKEVAVQVGE